MVVLIPLLVDDPLRVLLFSIPNVGRIVLIPLLVDDPLRDAKIVQLGGSPLS